MDVEFVGTSLSDGLISAPSLPCRKYFRKAHLLWLCACGSIFAAGIFLLFCSKRDGCDPTLNLSARSGVRLKITVSFGVELMGMDEGTSFVMEAGADETVGSLKKEITSRTGVPEVYQVLVYGGSGTQMILDDNQVFSSIAPETTDILLLLYDSATVPASAKRQASTATTGPPASVEVQNTAQRNLPGTQPSSAEEAQIKLHAANVMARLRSSPSQLEEIRTRNPEIAAAVERGDAEAFNRFFVDLHKLVREALVLEARAAMPEGYASETQPSPATPGSISQPISSKRIREEPSTTKLPSAVSSAGQEPAIMSSKVTLKPLHGAAFQVDASPEDKILDLKRKIAEAKPDYPADFLRLIYSGKILADEATIRESGYQHSGFIVIQVTKVAQSLSTARESKPAPAQVDPRIEEVMAVLRANSKELNSLRQRNPEIATAIDEGDSQAFRRLFAEIVKEAIAQAQPGTGPASRSLALADSHAVELMARLRANPAQLNSLRKTNPKIADAVDRGDAQAFHSFCTEIKKLVKETQAHMAAENVDSKMDTS